MLRNKLYIYGDGKLEVPVHMHVGKELFDRMLQYKDSIALINSDTNEQVTFTELAQQTANIALSLARIGVRKGDSISICSEKRLEVMPTLLGILCAGATYTPIDVTSGETQILHRVSIIKPKVVFCSLKGYDAYKKSLESNETIQTYILYGEEARPGAILFSDFVTESTSLEEFFPTPVIGWEDRAFIMSSSGTTGLPKGIPLTHLNYLTTSKIFFTSRFIGKRVLNTREWYYSYGMMFSIALLRAGATVVFSPRNQPTDWLSATQKYKIQIHQLTPSTAMDMVKNEDFDNYDLSSLEYIMSASTALLESHLKIIREKIPHLIDMLSAYGISEAGGTVSSNFEIEEKLRPSSSGVLAPGFICKVVDLDTREPLGPNQRGEICFKSPSLIKGYIGGDLAKDLDEDGFFKSGDLGYYDDDRHIYIVDRIKELLKFKDIAVAPEELESILLQHEAVRDVGVVGVPHEDYGQAPLAFVALQSNFTTTAEELMNFLHDRVTYRARLAGGVKFVDKLPRGGGAKLDRKALKQMISTL